MYSKTRDNKHPMSFAHPVDVNQQHQQRRLFQGRILDAASEIFHDSDGRDLPRVKTRQVRRSYCYLVVELGQADQHVAYESRGGNGIQSWFVKARRMRLC